MTGAEASAVEGTLVYQPRHMPAECAQTTRKSCVAIEAGHRARSVHEARPQGSALRHDTGNV